MPDIALTANDVILASACSGALELAINVLCSPGDSLLIPAPGFSLYQTICESRGINALHYQCLAERAWEIDLDHLEERIIKSFRKIKAILVNNPSNPCGSVFSMAHMRDIMALAKKYRLPIISDEVYHGMVFSHVTFVPFGQLSKEMDVPVITCGGLAKRFMVPGWRVGWILLFDPAGYLQAVRMGLHDLATIILGPNSLVQAAIPKIFERTPPSYYQQVNETLEVKGQALMFGPYLFRKILIFRAMP